MATPAARLPAERIQTYFCDGTVKMQRLGWYWRERHGDGRFGPSVGPFPSQDQARIAGERALDTP